MWSKIFVINTAIVLSLTTAYTKCFAAENETSISTAPKIQSRPSYTSEVLEECQYWDQNSIWRKHSEFNKVFNKLRLKTFTLENCTSQPIRIETMGKNESHTKQFTFELTAQEKIKTTEITRYLGARIANPSSLFLNIRENEDGFSVLIEDEEKAAFPPLYEDFNFSSQLFQDKDFQELSGKHKDLISSSNIGTVQGLEDFTTKSRTITDKAKFMHDFNGNFNYVKWAICPGEGIDPADIFAQRQRLFDLNHPVKLFSTFSTDSIVTPSRIPHSSNRIWFTSSQNPRELPDDYIDWMISSASVDPDWETSLWILDPDDLPRTMERLSETSIKVKSVRKALSMTLGSIFDKAIEENKFGQASDIARMEILREGGVYEDTDYRRHQSLNSFTSHYDFLAGLEPMSTFIGNAFVAASPNHPVVLKYLEMVERNYNPVKVPHYINTIPKDDGFRTILLTGPGALTAAFYKGAGQPGKVDALMPPDVFYPAIKRHYPEKLIVKPFDSLPIASIGAHYWETSWLRFGSKG